MPPSKSHPIKQIDRRVVERYIRRGIVADKDHKQLIKDLPDLEGQYVVITLPENATDDDDSEGGQAES